MKKLVLLCAPLFVLLPVIGMASSCLPYDLNYALQANGASGTLNKVQVMSGNHFLIKAIFKVNKLFIHRTIVQTATGTCDANGNIIAQSFSSDKDNNNAGPIALDNHKLDTLSLVLFLSSALNANTPTFPVIPLLYSGNNISVQCAITSRKAIVTLDNGQPIPTTAITCATTDNSIMLNYSFSQDSSHIMLAASAIEKGVTTMSANIL